MQLRIDTASTSKPATSRTAEQPRSIYIEAMQQHVQDVKRELEARVRRRHASAARLEWLIAVALVIAAGAARPAHASPEDDADVAVEVDLADEDAAFGEVDASAGASRAADTAAGPTRVSDRHHPPPQIAEVLEAAYVAAGLAHDPTPSWRRRARVAGLIPWVSVRAGWDARWRDDEPGDVGRTRDFEVRATWRLDRLLFDGRELQASTIDAARRRERRRLATQVIRTYFAWRKVAAAAARDPRFRLAAEAATAELDALTDGWFSDRGESRR